MYPYRCVVIQMEVDVTDVDVELGPGALPAAEVGGGDWEAEPEPRLQGFDPQYVKELFTSCIQAAVAVVRDADDCAARATRRITILLQLLEGGTVDKNNNYSYKAH